MITGENEMIYMKKILDEHTESKCNHPEYDGSVCWRVVNEELQTEAKFCQHKRDKEFIHRYEKAGFMAATEHDMMITKPCIVCNKVKLIRTDTETCKDCSYIRSYK